MKIEIIAGQAVGRRLEVAQIFGRKGVAPGGDNIPDERGYSGWLQETGGQSGGALIIKRRAQIGIRVAGDFLHHIGFRHKPKWWQQTRPGSRLFYGWASLIHVVFWRYVRALHGG